VYRATIRSIEVNGIPKASIQRKPIGRTNNFMASQLERVNVCCEEFGFRANVLKTNLPYVPDAVQPVDYMPAAAEEGTDALPALGVAATVGLRLEAEKQRNKTVAKLKIDVQSSMLRYGRPFPLNQRRK
jgi:hypothetical protein